ncbi:carboxylesterase/lipase family protein [Paratractidigestivibacter sp.]|uniref:carboxylesterase/lipase family protein n=1 Tax=Paratractidigestivibacter sp. TaxID=2847316 RepID=UPI002ABDEAF4|nr:carboxylesterase family protein [Paratractidigestivibacter sp.]
MKPMTRRKLLKGAGIAAGVIAVAGVGGAFALRRVMAPDTTPGPGEEGQTVALAQGQLKGTVHEGVHRFLGIPYAQAHERFVPADPSPAWDGVRDASAYGPMSPQGSMLGFSAGSQSGTDNDCQNLNVWTPGLDDAARPVMVWLHGGGFSTGTANDSSYDGEALSGAGDVVVVSVNHRLNVFGHLDLSAYGEKYARSANIGMDDIVLALRWVGENIRAFGGDPANVTVFGQSGGGAKVLALMSIPEARGLFQRGIVESGATQTVGEAFTSREASARLTQNLLAELQISEDDVEQLQSVDVSKLQSASTSALQKTADEFQIPAPLSSGYQMEWEPVVDGDFLPSGPVTEDGFAEAGREVPLLIGSNLNEWTVSPLGGSFVTETDELKAAVAEAYPNVESLTADHVDTLIRPCILRIAAHKASRPEAPVFAYVMTNGTSSHGAEIPFVFRHSDNAQMSGLMSEAWVSFARGGAPAADGLPEWEPYTHEGGATMLLDTASTLAYHHDEKLLELLGANLSY